MLIGSVLFAAQAPQREVIRSSPQIVLLDGRLSPFWAQEYVGADLAIESLSRFRNGSSASVPTVLFDTSQFDDHQSIARQLLSGETPAAFSKVVRIQKMFDVGLNQSCAPSSSCFSRAAEGVMTAMTDTEIISVSMSGVERSDIPALQALSQRGIKIFISAGNYYASGPRSSVAVSELSKSESAIVVGSMSPTGWVSAFTSEANGTSVLAPADVFALAGISGAAGFEYRLVGGTTVATPIVTAAVSNALALIPGLSTTAVMELIRRTSIRVPESLISAESGAGMINAYGIEQVAERIYKRCHHRGQIAECATRWIRTPQVYRFGRDSGFASRILKAFPGCSERWRGSQSDRSSEELSGDVRRLRSQALLHRESSADWRALACVYRAYGYSVNAAFYEAIADRGESKESVLGLSGKVRLLALASDANRVLRATAIRAIGQSFTFTPQEKVDAFLRAVDLGDPDHWSSALVPYEIGKQRLAYAAPVLEKILFGEKRFGEPVLSAALKAASSLGERGQAMLIRSVHDFTRTQNQTTGKEQESAERLQIFSSNLLQHMIPGGGDAN